MDYHLGHHLHACQAFEGHDPDGKYLFEQNLIAITDFKQRIGKNIKRILLIFIYFYSMNINHMMICG